MEQGGSVLHAEIFDQPAALRRFLEAEAEHVAEIGRLLAKRKVCYVLIAARGTSGNAARYGQYLFGALNRLPVVTATLSLFTVYDSPPNLAEGLVIGISQSGQSPDIVSVLEAAHRQGAPTIAITNDASSPLAQAADAVIALHVGLERSIAATKTYTAQLLALAMLSMSMARMPLHPSALDSIPTLVEQALTAEPAAQAAAEGIASSDRCVVLGRGFNMATAFEIALKVKELTYVEAEPQSSATFRHGPIAVVEAGFPVLLLAVGEKVRGELLALGGELRERGGRLVVFGQDGSLRHPADLWIPVPNGLTEWLTPPVAVVPGQLLAYHLARARGVDPDRPRTLHKVTLTL